MIQVGKELSKCSAESLLLLIEGIFKTGAETRMDQATIVAALGLVTDATRVENISITGCCFTEDKRTGTFGDANADGKNMNVQKPESELGELS